MVRGKIISSQLRASKMEADSLKLSSANQKLQPRDTLRIAYILHFLLGLGNLLPWNASITAVDYFSYLYPTKHVEKVFSVAYMSSSLLALVFMMSFEGLTKKLSFRFRMNFGFSLFILSLMVYPSMDWIWSETDQLKKRPGGAFGLTVSAIFVCGLADGLVGATLIGSAGKLPRQYMQAVFAGTASSGIVVSILRIISKASLPQTPKGLQTSAHFYFIVATLILLLSIVSSNLLCKLPLMKYQDGILYNAPALCSKLVLQAVTGKIRWPAFGIFIIYLVTLSIFPGFLAEDLESKFLRDWYPILLISVYNVADLVGKTLPAIYVVKSLNKTTWFCIGRLVFYPLFIACIHGPIWLRTEIPIVALTFMLGLTNGYLTSVLMICTPKSVSASEAEISAIVMVVFLGLGLVSGSVLGWFWII